MDFGDRPPWSVLTTRTLVAHLHLDRGVFATWRCRGIGPAELPPAWFRPASGRPNYFLASSVLAWLAARRGEPFDHHAYWLAFLRRVLGDDWSDLGHVRQLARQGWLVPKGEAPFTRTGLDAYIAHLGLSPAENV